MSEPHNGKAEERNRRASVDDHLSGGFLIRLGALNISGKITGDAVKAIGVASDSSISRLSSGGLGEDGVNGIPKRSG